MSKLIKGATMKKTTLYWVLVWINAIMLGFILSNIISYFLFYG